MTGHVSGITVQTRFYQDSSHYDVCNINGSKFALFSKEIHSKENISIDLSNYNIIFLSPMEAEMDISIKAISVIILNNVHSQKGKVEIEASGKCIFLSSKTQGIFDNIIKAKSGIFSASIIEERHKRILKEFNKGISEERGSIIVDTLIETYDALNDPLGENKNPHIDVAKALEFLNISKEG